MRAVHPTLKRFVARLAGIVRRLRWMIRLDAATYKLLQEEIDQAAQRMADRVCAQVAFVDRHVVPRLYDHVAVLPRVDARLDDATVAYTAWIHVVSYFTTLWHDAKVDATSVPLVLTGPPNEPTLSLRAAPDSVLAQCLGRDVRLDAAAVAAGLEDEGWICTPGQPDGYALAVWRAVQPMLRDAPDDIAAFRYVRNPDRIEIYALGPVDPKRQPSVRESQARGEAAAERYRNRRWWQW